MARIRSIKPEFWTDSAVVACSMPARLLFLGIWNHADDYGVVKDDPGQLKRQVLPEDDVDGAGLVDELVEQKLLVRRVAADETPVLVVRTWERHQKVDTRSPGRYGTPDSFATPLRPPDPPASRPIPPDPNPGREGNGVDIAPAEPPQKQRASRQGTKPDASASPAGDSEASARRDDLWDAVMAVCGIDSRQIPSRQRSGYGRAVADLRSVDATASEVRRRAAVYRATYRDVSLTPHALAKHWAQLAGRNGTAPPADAHGNEMIL